MLNFLLESEFGTEKAACTIKNAIIWIGSSSPAHVQPVSFPLLAATVLHNAVVAPSLVVSLTPSLAFAAVKEGGNKQFKPIRKIL